MSGGVYLRNGIARIPGSGAEKTGIWAKHGAAARKRLLGRKANSYSADADSHSGGGEGGPALKSAG